MQTEKNPSAIVFTIKRSSMDDGPGLRTNFFLKGCPLRCLWCCNPEGQELYPELNGKEGCGFFEKVMTVEEVMEIALRDKVFFQISGGGVTIAGGEPTMQTEFTGELLRRCREEGIHTCLDTCGYAVGPAAKLLEQADMLLYDLKIINEERHIRATGVSNRPILDNFHRLGAMGKPMRVRVPVIPGYTDDAENLDAIAGLVAEYPSVERIELIGFHSYAIPKYECLGKEEHLSSIPPISHEALEDIRRRMLTFGVRVNLGG